MATNNSINLAEGLLGQLVTNTGSGFDNTTATYPSVATTTGTLLRADGTNWVKTTSTFADTYAASTLLYSNGANTITGLTTANNGLLVTGNTGIPSILAGPGTTGHILQSNAALAPSFSTATYPSVATSTGTILRADGTNWVATTATYPATTTINQILYSSSNNVIGEITTANTGVLVTSSSGAPSIAQDVSFASGHGILDAAGKNQLLFTQTASAVNYLHITNAATGSYPSIASAGTDSTIGMTFIAKGATPIIFGNNGGANNIAYFSSSAGTIVNYIGFNATPTLTAPSIFPLGSDTNILLQISGKGTSGVGIQGVTTNTNAVSGNVGEYTSSIIGFGSPVPLVNATPKTITSLTLGAGDWMIYGEFGVTGNGSTTVTYIQAGISNTDNTFATVPSDTAASTSVKTTAGTNWTIAGGTPYLSMTPCRQILSGNTTVYLVAQVNFGTSTCSGAGKIAARRVR